jgi:pimeloyl-ACP methyl ester carboxylesterase
LEAAVRFIAEHHAVSRASLIAHSWGTIVAGEFAGRCPELVERLVFFGPIARRTPEGERQRLPGWRLISLEDQWQRFTADVPAGEEPVLSRRHFDEWGQLYLDTDPQSRTRSPAAVKTPSGAFQDICPLFARLVENRLAEGRTCKSTSPGWSNLRLCHMRRTAHDNQRHDMRSSITARGPGR